VTDRLGDLEIVGKYPLSQGSGMLKSQRKNTAANNEIQN
jgi:hypothetical protein